MRWNSYRHTNLLRITLLVKSRWSHWKSAVTDPVSGANENPQEGDMGWASGFPPREQRSVGAFPQATRVSLRYFLLHEQRKYQ